MVERQDPHRDKPGPQGRLPGPFDGFAAATAVGFAMTAQALDMWFGVMSGVAKASKNMLEPQLKAKPGEPAAYAPTEKPAAVRAKSATRTVVADIERAVQDVAEVAVDLLGGKTQHPTEDQPATETPGKSGDVVAFEAKPAPPKRPKALKSADKKPTPVEAASPIVKAESKSVESVAVEASPVASSEVEASVQTTAGQTSDEGVNSTAGPAIMPEDFRQPRAMNRPSTPDDLKLIVGVGPKLEKVLNGLGVWTFEQVAAWSPEETAWVDDYLGLSGRIARDGWVAQADGRAKGMKAAG